MGKAADNERIKLKATFANNLAVASLVAGAIVPALLYQAQELEMFSKHGIVSLISVLVAFGVSVLFRGLADSIIQAVQD